MIFASLHEKERQPDTHKRPPPGGGVWGRCDVRHRKQHAAIGVGQAWGWVGRHRNSSNGSVLLLWMWPVEEVFLIYPLSGL